MSAVVFTDWIPGKENPVRIGVYQRNFGLRKPLFSYWDGLSWMIAHATPAAAVREKDAPSAQQTLQWRGIRKWVLLRASEPIYGGAPAYVVKISRSGRSTEWGRDLKNAKGFDSALEALKYRNRSRIFEMEQDIEAVMP